jgi:hypothetical protein
MRYTLDWTVPLVADASGLHTNATMAATSSARANRALRSE